MVVSFLYFLSALLLNLRTAHHNNQQISSTYSSGVFPLLLMVFVGLVGATLFAV